MKKILVVLAVLFAFGIKQASAQARVTYYYYPSANVYYNVGTHQYVYYDPGVTTWTTVKTLPSGVTITRTPRYTVYYNGPDVWKDNAMHKTKYKVQRTTVVTKPSKNKITPVKKGKGNKH